MESLVAILTPTYNRAHLLKRLYFSLVCQSYLDFEWIIVDDGSDDGTKELVESLIQEEKITICYYKKSNGGKHTALNEGLKHISSKYTFIVDSDDFLTEDAVETIYEYDKKYADNNRICGYSFLRKFPDGKINIKSGRNYDYISSYNQVRVREQRFGDMAEVYRTEVLKLFPFPEFKNEKFLGEDIVWVQIGKIYDLCFVNKAIYVSNYLIDGLTLNRRVNNLNSPKGCYLRAHLLLEIPKLPLKFLCKTIMQLHIYGRFSDVRFRCIKKDSNHPFLCFMLFFPSYMIYLKWKTEGNRI